MRLIIISNRLPLTIKKHGESFEYTQTSGGLVTGLKAVKETLPFLWLGNISGMSLTEQDRETINNDCWELFRSKPVFISTELNEKSYNGFCNGILWPLLHIFPDDVTFSIDLYEAYKEYNTIFCDKVIEIAEDGDVIWVHDYHLMLLPQMLRLRCKKDIRIGFFLHIPFSIADIFSVLPCAYEIIMGILGADHIGFHSYDYLANFIESCKLHAPTKKAFGGSDDQIIDYMNGNVDVGTRTLRLSAIPIGIDPEIFRTCLAKKETQQRIKDLKAKFAGKKIIIGVDRTDYIKGIPNRISGFKKYLEREINNNVIFLQVAVPSRTDVPEYASLINTFNRMVSELNGSIGNVDETFFYLLNRSVPLEELCALYAVADCCLISSLIDGMNLVALEFVACQSEKKGILILSENAGAQSTLPGSVFFNPYNIDGIADAIEYSLNMNEIERCERFEVNCENVEKFTAVYWAQRNIDGLTMVKGISDEDREIKAV